MFYSKKPQEALNLISYKGVLVRTLLHATVYMFLYNLLNVLVKKKSKAILVTGLGGL
jgi:hypothetical protein